MAGHDIATETPGYRVRVEIDGTTVADSTKAVTLAETGYPVRRYLPRADVRLELFKHTDTSTHCPFKGDAEYWSFGERTNVAWSYPAGQSTREAITDLIAFDDARVALHTG
jgi:uncharacterized protein (DUF427 family)